VSEKFIPSQAPCNFWITEHMRANPEWNFCPKCGRPIPEHEGF